jgi:hypothetical protein
VKSGWSPDYKIGNPVDERPLIAVMPMENLAGTAAPFKEMMTSLRESLKRKGVNILGDDAREKFMERHRVRYAGGLTHELGKAFREETGTEAVLFLSLDHYEGGDPPGIALTARLVSTDQRAVILWMDSVAMAGNDAPGFLGLGRVHDSRVLRRRAMEKIVDSLVRSLAGRKSQGEGRDVAGGPDSGGGSRGTYRPKEFYKVPPKPAAGGEPLRIAVLPFLNDSRRRNAGEILALQFMKQLYGRRNLEVVEPGELRQALLSTRTIMEGGLSIPQAELLHAVLGVDLLLTGNVMNYADSSGPWGTPTVNFSARVFDVKTRRVTWSSISYNWGDDGVFFFGMGKVTTAHALASRMVQAVAGRMATDGASR